MKWKSECDGVPMWVNVLHYWMEFVDYRIVSPISSWLVYRRIDLIDQHCNCGVCRGKYKHDG